MTEKAPARPGRVWIRLLITALAATAWGQAQRARYPAVGPRQWMKPPLIQWQRSLDDALHLVQKTKRPLLICVNMDGEVACRVFAGVKYRDPGFAKLVERYVPLIVSPDRHNPRDYDDRGHRIPCPRFGTVTCGEHQRLEQKVFERYFGRRRVAPRHLGIDLDGSTMFDRYLDRDLSLVDAALEQNAPEAAVPRASAASKGGALSVLVSSRDSLDRAMLETRYSVGTRRERRALLEAASTSEVGQAELLRLGLKERDPELRRAAALGIAATAGAADLLLLLDALGVTAAQDDRRRLLETLGRLAKEDLWARRSLTVRTAIQTTSAHVPVQAWLEALRNPVREWPAEEVSNEEIDALDGRIDQLLRQRRKGDPQGTLNLALAEANFRFALDRMRRREDPSALLMDADSAAEAAAEHGAPEWKVGALRCRIAWLLERPADAAHMAGEVVRHMLAEAGSPMAAAILGIHARAQAAKVYEKLPDGADYPPEAITEAHSAYRVLAQHPYGSLEHALGHVALLDHLGTQLVLRQTLEAALRRYPGSEALHQRYRKVVLRQDGAEGLEAAYRNLPAAAPMRPTLDWYAGYAFLIAAETHQRYTRGSEALAAYEQSIRRFEQSLAADAKFADSVNHYVALALAGQARIAVDDLRTEAAVELLLQSAARRPETYRVKNGLGKTAEDTTDELREFLELIGDKELCGRLDSALEKLGLRRRQG
ncbi:MAG: hypothetical protein ACE5F1_17150 [Planctomycetota bacterium]